MMAGGGSMQSMITILRNNKKLLRKKSMFKKERSFLNSKKEYYKAAEGQISQRKPTQKQIAFIRKKILKERKKEAIRTALILLALSPLFILLLYKGVELHNNKIQYKTAIAQIELDKKTEKYHFFITDGDRWIDKKNWHNAIFQYKKALELFPQEFDANYRLALAYSYTCINNNRGCETGKNIVDKLIEQFSQNPELKELQTMFTKKIDQ